MDKRAFYAFTLKVDLKECIKRDKIQTDELGEQATTDVFNLVSAFDYGINIDKNGKTPAIIVDEITSHLPPSPINSKPKKLFHLTLVK